MWTRNGNTSCHPPHVTAIGPIHGGADGAEHLEARAAKAEGAEIRVASASTNMPLGLHHFEAIDKNVDMIHFNV